MRLKKSLGIQCQTVYQHAWRTDLLLFQICEENLNNIDSVKYNKVTNVGIKQNAEDLLKPLSVAVDKIQEKKLYNITSCSYLGRTGKRPYGRKTG